MTKGIKGKILSAFSKNDIKEIDVFFASSGTKYEVKGLKMVFSGNVQNEFRFYMDGTCVHNGEKYKHVSIRVLFSQQFPLTHHISIEDFKNQEASLFLM